MNVWTIISLVATAANLGMILFWACQCYRAIRLNHALGNLLISTLQLRHWPMLDVMMSRVPPGHALTVAFGIERVAKD